MRYNLGYFICGFISLNFAINIAMIMFVSIREGHRNWIQYRYLKVSRRELATARAKKQASLKSLGKQVSNNRRFRKTLANAERNLDLLDSMSVRMPKHGVNLADLLQQSEATQVNTE